MPKSMLSDRVIIDLVVAKYWESLPLYRQQAMLRRDAGLEIALSTLDDAVMLVGDLLLPIAAAMKRELLSGTYIQADEIIKPAYGNTVRPPKASSSIFEWIATVMDRSCSLGLFRGCSKRMGTPGTIRSSAARWCMPAAWRMRAASSSMPSR